MIPEYRMTSHDRRLTSEVTELEAYRTPAPKPPEPPCAPAIEVEPDFQEVLILASVNGHDVPAARQRVLARTRGYVERLRTVCPAVYEGVLAARECIAGTTILHHHLVKVAIEKISEVEGMLRARGASLREAEAHRIKLEDANARLQSDTVVELDPVEAFRLQKLSQHLPAHVFEAEAFASRMEGQIRRLVEDHKIDLAALITEMVCAARNERRQIVDQQIITLESAGYLSLPEIPISVLPVVPEVTALNSADQLNLAP